MADGSSIFIDEIFGREPRWSDRETINDTVQKAMGMARGTFSTARSRALLAVVKKPPRLTRRKLGLRSGKTEAEIIYILPPNLVHTPTDLYRLML